MNLSMILYLLFCTFGLTVRVAADTKSAARAGNTGR